RRRVFRYAGRSPDRARRRHRRQPVVGPGHRDREEHAVSDEESRIMIVTRKHLPRRTVLRGLGASVALPLLDGMVPAFAAPPSIRRFGAIYVGMGMNMPVWSQQTGGELNIHQILAPLSAY